jgi:CRP-like cAMP-binding protein
MNHPRLGFRREDRMNVLARVAPRQWTGHPFVARVRRYVDLGEAELDLLGRLIESEFIVKKRRDLIIDGYEYRKLCFVEDGFAARYRLLRNGKRQIVNVVLPGDVIGLPCSFLERATYSVSAISDLKLQACSIDAYGSLCYKRPQFGLILSWLAVEEAAIYAERIIDTGRRTPIERLARFLLELHSRLAIVGRTSASGFDLPFSQEVVGDALGLSVPHLNRMLTQLRQEGLIAIEGRNVEFIDLKALQLLGQFQPLNLTRIPSHRAFVPAKTGM